VGVNNKAWPRFCHMPFFYELAYIVDGMAVRVLGHSGNKKTKKVKRNKMKI
jgi:hypothetical protein